MNTPDRRLLLLLLPLQNTHVLGTFIENHDLPRFANTTVDPQLIATAVAFSFVTDGIPVVYYGQEQNFHGIADPVRAHLLRLTLFPSRTSVIAADLSRPLVSPTEKPSGRQTTPTPQRRTRSRRSTLFANGSIRRALPSKVRLSTRHRLRSSSMTARPSPFERDPSSVSSPTSVSLLFSLTLSFASPAMTPGSLTLGS